MPNHEMWKIKKTADRIDKLMKNCESGVVRTTHNGTFMSDCLSSVLGSFVALCELRDVKIIKALPLQQLSSDFHQTLFKVW